MDSRAFVLRYSEQWPVVRVSSALIVSIRICINRAFGWYVLRRREWINCFVWKSEPILSSSSSDCDSTAISRTSQSV